MLSKCQMVFCIPKNLIFYWIYRYIRKESYKKEVLLKEVLLIE